jgi:hypothetical protein
MELSPSSRANSRSASQEISHILWNPKVHYRVHKSPPLVHILSQMDRVHIFTPKLLSNIIPHLRLGLPLRFSDQNCVSTQHVLYVPQIQQHKLQLAKVKSSVCLTNYYDMKTYLGSRGIAPRVPKFDSRLR